MKRTFLKSALVLILMLGWGMTPLRTSADVAGTPVVVFDNLASFTLPATAAAPRRLNAKLYQVRPQSADSRFVMLVAREALLPGERARTTAALVPYYRKILAAAGYQILSLKAVNNTVEADFRTYAKVPWQKVGTALVRGRAKFTRTAPQELVGSVLLCDPAQWTQQSLTPFKQTVANLAVSG
jgi:hypothetical protein